MARPQVQGKGRTELGGVAHTALLEGTAEELSSDGPGTCPLGELWRLRSQEETAPRPHYKFPLACRGD